MIDTVAEWAIVHRWWVAAAAVVAVTVVIGLGTGNHPDPAYPLPRPLKTVAVTPWPEPTNRQTPPTVPAGTTSAPASAETEQQTQDRVSLRLAGRFIEAWLDASGGRDVWLQHCFGYVTTGLYSGLGLTDVANLPAVGTHMEGDPVLVTSGPALVRARLDLSDGTAVLVDVIHDPKHGGELRISNIVPDRS